MYYFTMMYLFFVTIFFRLYHYVLVPLRYKLRIIGADRISAKKTDPKGGILFLANHPSHLDATILSLSLLKYRYLVSIWTLEYVFKNPYTRFVARNHHTTKLMKVPMVFEKRQAKNFVRTRKLISRTVDALKAGENVMFFPSGTQKHIPREEINGKSAVQRILRLYPDVNIVLIRETGMWGSRFSKAVAKTERSSATRANFVRFVWNLAKMILFNLVFFIPKRKVMLEFDNVGDDFPRYGSRKEINAYLEEYYNRGFGPEGEPLYRVPDYFWKAKYVPIEYHVKNFQFNLDNIPSSIKNDVLQIVAKKALLPPGQLRMDMLLGRDLALDSLEITDILIEIESKYNVPKYLPKHVSTIGHLIAMVSKAPIDSVPVKGKIYEIRQEVPVPVRAWQACAGLITSMFGFLHSHH